MLRDKTKQMKDYVFWGHITEIVTGFRGRQCSSLSAQTRPRYVDLVCDAIAEELVCLSDHDLYATVCIQSLLHLWQTIVWIWAVC